MSEENGVSYTDSDQLIRKRQNVVEKSTLYIYTGLVRLAKLSGIE